MHTYNPNQQFHSYVNILEKSFHLFTYPEGMAKNAHKAEHIVAQNVKQPNIHEW
jgi:hypothetical protein